MFRIKPLAAPFAALAVSLTLMPAHAAAAVVTGATVKRPVAFTVSPPLRDMQWQLPPAVQRIIAGRNLNTMQLAELEQKLVAAGFFNRKPAPESKPESRLRPALPQPKVVADTARQGGIDLPPGTRAPEATTAADFNGLASSDPTSGHMPPDPNIAVGEKYIVEMVNDQFAVYDKRGNLVMGPVDNNTLWQNFGGTCETTNDGDPIVVYDEAAHRWLLSQFTGRGSGPPYYECIAVSETDDPTGGYYQYAFETSTTLFADYPKIGVWPDGYYATFHDFDNNNPVGVTIVAYDRAAMLRGDSNAAMQKVRVDRPNPGGLIMLPADPDGTSSPPRGEPELFASYMSPNTGGNGYALDLWTMKVDWNNAADTVFKGPETIPVPPFNDFACGSNASRACIPQPDTPRRIDSISDRLMYRLAYRNFGDHEAIAVDQTVDVGPNDEPPTGIRWYQLTTSSPGAEDWKLAQAGTWAPTDGDSRWMGSIAMDDDGDMMLGYSVSGPDRHPSIAVTGRLAGDPGNVMTLPEHVVAAGTGDALGKDPRGASVRWGDYTSMVVDPSDDRTFWYVNEYFPTTSRAGWETRIAAIRFAAAQPVTSGAIRGTVTHAGDGSPVSHALVRIEPGNIRTVTDRRGRYRIAVDAGAYTVTPSKYPLAANDSKQASVSAGQTVIENFSLSPAPLVPLSGSVTDGGTDADAHGWGLFTHLTLKVLQFDGSSRSGDTYTAPATGRYRIDVPDGYRYIVTATPSLRAYRDGYDPARASVTANGPASLDFVLPVKHECTAPGYGAAAKFHEDFDSGTFPPSGWTVVNDGTASAPAWGTEQDFGTGVGNWTGGALHAAMIDASKCPDPGCGADTSLVSPPIPVSELGGATTLSYRVNAPGPGTLAVAISSDSGRTWSPLLTWGQGVGYGKRHGLPGKLVAIDLSRRLPASGDFQLRWRYAMSATPAFFGDVYAQIDDVAIGQCHFRAGGLVTGQLLDATGAGLTGATVTDDLGNAATTRATGKNAPLRDIYALFTRTGHRTLTAAPGSGGTAVKAVDVTDDHASRRDLALGSADIAVSQKVRSPVPRGVLAPATAVTIANNGPDPASGVTLALKATSYLRLESAIASRGDCRTDNRSRSVNCTLGQIPAGATVTVAVKAFGLYAGQATITASGSVDNNDPAPGNNVSTAQVTVNSTAQPGAGSSGGGGALGWLSLAGLLGLALGAAAARSDRKH